MFRRDRPSGHKAGVLTLVRNAISAVQTKQTDSCDLEFLTIKLLLTSGELYITNCYSPPNSRLSLDTIPLERQNHLIIGDFNGHSLS